MVSGTRNLEKDSLGKSWRLVCGCGAFGLAGLACLSLALQHNHLRLRLVLVDLLVPSDVWLFGSIEEECGHHINTNAKGITLEDLFFGAQRPGSSKVGNQTKVD